MKPFNAKTWIVLVALTGATACTQKVAFSPSGADKSANSAAGVGTGGTAPGTTGTGGGSGGTPSSGGPGTCTGNIGSTTELTKMLFIIDMSGSNELAPGCTIGTNCTDPDKKMRDGSMQKFLNDYGVKSNFDWSFEVFNGTTATPMITNSGGSPIFSTASAMQSALNNFMTMTDTDNTPYLAALQTATTTIANDPDLHSNNNPQYIVVFMSDGQPDGTGDTASAITAQISSIVALHPGKITFNTVYYGTGDATAAGLLQTMAQTGNGNFLNTSANPSGLDFQISDLINVPCP